MSTLPLDSQAATKVIAKACDWVDQRRATQAAPEDQKARAAGRLKVSGNQLAEAVEKYRQQTGQQHGEACPP